MAGGRIWILGVVPDPGDVLAVRNHFAGQAANAQIQFVQLHVNPLEPTYVVTPHKHPDADEKRSLDPAGEPTHGWDCTALPQPITNF